MRVTSLVVGALSAATVIAHPGHDHAKEARERRAAMEGQPRSLAHCAEKIKARGLEARNIARRAALATKLSKRGNIKTRDYTDLYLSHASSEPYTLSTPEATVFATNNSCVLSPEVTEGPYYVAGEYVRADLMEGQAGVPLAFDIQVLDTTTCEPVPNVYTEIWHANATGVYSGVAANGNGNGAADTSNLKTTFARGIQKTDSDGTVQFNTMFPGHYTGRAIHIHILVHTAATERTNGTLFDTTASHVGQAFFDQDLISRVELNTPYSTNKQALVPNAYDIYLYEEAITSDPFVQYVQLGDSITEGLLGWISFGITPQSGRTVSAAANYYQGGGVENAGGGFPF